MFNCFVLVCSLSDAAVNFQRKNGLKALDNLRSAQNIPKAGPANKLLTTGTSVRRSRRNVVRT